MYRNINTYHLRYTDVDAYDNLKLSSLLSFMEESACLSADELGFGYKALTPKKFGFIIVNWYIELNRAIKLGEQLTVHTWPLPPKRLIFLRDFELFVGDEKVGAATSRWCMINTENFSMLPSSAFFVEGDFDGYNTQRSIEFSSWKIPPVTKGELKYSKYASLSDYDHYFHVNNTKYADFLTDVFSVKQFEGKRIGSVQITYVKQCKIGERIDIYLEQADGSYLVEGRVEGEARVQMRIRLDDV